MAPCDYGMQSNKEHASRHTGYPQDRALCGHHGGPDTGELLGPRTQCTVPPVKDPKPAPCGHWHATTMPGPARSCSASFPDGVPCRPDAVLYVEPRRGRWSAEDSVDWVFWGKAGGPAVSQGLSQMATSSWCLEGQVHAMPVGLEDRPLPAIQYAPGHLLSVDRRAKCKPGNLKTESPSLQGDTRAHQTHTHDPGPQPPAPSPQHLQS